MSILSFTFRWFFFIFALGDPSALTVFSPSSRTCQVAQRGLFSCPAWSLRVWLAGWRTWAAFTMHTTFTLCFVFCSVAQSWPILCNPMDCSTPGFPVLHYLPEFAQTHVRWVDDAIQPSSSVAPFSSCPQSFPASGYFQVSWLFAAGGQSIGALASVLPVNIQGWFPLGLIALISLLFMGLSGVSSSTTVWKHQFFGTQLSLWSNSHIRTWLLVKP